MPSFNEVVVRKQGEAQRKWDAEGSASMHTMHAGGGGGVWGYTPAAKVLKFMLSEVTFRAV